MGKIIKIVLLVLLFSGVILFILSSLNFTLRKYYRYVKDAKDEILETEVVTTDDIKDYPTALKKYFQYTGIIGKERATHIEMVMSGEMKMDEEKEFAPISVKQFSVMDPSTRVFFIRMKYNGLKINGIHYYDEEQAMMKIKLLDLLKVVDVSGETMRNAETVTVFNDMVLFAPSSLLDDRFTFEEIDDLTVKGTFNNDGIVVSATLYFNQEGQLINFVSYDRWVVDDEIDHSVSWSTPIYEYKETNGLNLVYKGSAIWGFEDREFEYIKLEIEEVVTNP